MIGSRVPTSKTSESKNSWSADSFSATSGSAGKLLAMAVLIGLTLTACAKTQVVLTAPTPDVQVRRECSSLISRLPKQVADQEWREIAKTSTSDPEITAAWGEPVIGLRCGVTRPATIESTSQLITVNRVDWFPEQLSSGWRFTSMNTQGFVEVTVPNKYQPEANALVDLSTAIKPQLVGSP
ncbi:MAG: DUF3515 family protein [Actinomycetales bacterium]|nr:DUF3515 family protein [Actinomycetales bacterium]